MVSFLDRLRHGPTAAIVIAILSSPSSCRLLVAGVAYLTTPSARSSPFHAAAHGPECSRDPSVCCSHRRRPEAVGQRDDHSSRLQPRGLPDGADADLHAGAGRLGGHSGRSTAGSWPTSMSACSTSSPSPRSASTASSWLGWASNSIATPFLGALRSAAQMVSYEVSMGFVIDHRASFALGSLNGSRHRPWRRNASAGLFSWFFLPLLPMFVIFFVSALAETNRAPFDLPEAEAELVAGYNVEYSAMPFALFFLGEYANMILMSAMAVDPLSWRLAAADSTFRRSTGFPGRHLVRAQGIAGAVLLPLGARDFPALSLRSVDAPGLEGVLAASPCSGWW